MSAPRPACASIDAAGRSRVSSEELNYDSISARRSNSLPSPSIRSTTASSARNRALLALGKSDGHWCFELEADCTIPAEYVLMRHYRDEPVDAELEGKIGNYLRRLQGDHGGWPLFQDGAFNISASVKAYFALKMIGDDIDAPHMARARAAILRAWRRRAKQCVHARSAGALWRNPVARRAGDAGRDHAAAEMVSVPSRQGFLLGAHGSRAAAGADGEKAAREESARRAYRRTVRHAARRGAPVAQGRTSDFSLDGDIRRSRQAAACRRAFLPQIDARDRDRPRRKLDDGTAQRRRRPRRDLPGDGQQPADV